MKAHYYGSKTKGFTVSGKAEAKKIAKEHNAQQWNF